MVVLNPDGRYARTHPSPRPVHQNGSDDDAQCHRQRYLVAPDTPGVKITQTSEPASLFILCV